MSQFASAMENVAALVLPGPSATERARYTVFVVEDNIDDERLTVRALNKARSPLEIVVARDGEAAIGFLEQLTASEVLPDLVLLDLKLPKASGFEVLEFIRSKDFLKDLPVVILTSSSEPSDTTRAWALGASGYTQKPVEYQGYVAAITSIAESWLPD